MSEKSRQKPIWFLDVDGVINLLTTNHPDIPHPNRRFEVINGFPINWDTRVVDFINHAVGQDLVEMRWLTTWEDLARDKLAPALGLVPFKVPTKPMRTMTTFPARTGAAKNRWWKWESILHHTDADALGHRDVIWTDDDLHFELASQLGAGPEIRRWISMRRALNLQTLGISPRPSRGLTPAHLEEIGTILTSQPRIITGEMLG